MVSTKTQTRYSKHVQSLNILMKKWKKYKPFENEHADQSSVSSIYYLYPLLILLEEEDQAVLQIHHIPSRD